MNYSILTIAAVGAICINLLNLIEAANLPLDQRPNFKDWLYWIAYPIGAALGAFVAYAYIESGFEIKPLLAVHIGASSPLILRAMASVIPRTIKTEIGA